MEARQAKNSNQCSLQLCQGLPCWPHPPSGTERSPEVVGPFQRQPPDLTEPKCPGTPSIPVTLTSLREHGYVLQAKRQPATASASHSDIVAGLLRWRALRCCVPAVQRRVRGGAAVQNKVSVPRAVLCPLGVPRPPCLRRLRPMHVGGILPQPAALQALRKVQPGNLHFPRNPQPAHLRGKVCRKGWVHSAGGAGNLERRSQPGGRLLHTNQAYRGAWSLGSAAGLPGLDCAQIGNSSAAASGEGCCCPQAIQSAGRRHPPKLTLLSNVKAANDSEQVQAAMTTTPSTWMPS